MQNINKLAAALGFNGTPEFKIQRVRDLYVRGLIPTSGVEVDTGAVKDGKPVKKRVVHIDGIRVDVTIDTIKKAGEELGFRLVKVERWETVPAGQVEPAHNVATPAETT